MADKTYLSKEINFNKAPVCWQGLEVYPGNGAASNLYGTLNVIKNPEEPTTPDINTDGNLTVRINATINKNLRVDGESTFNKDVKMNKKLLLAGVGNAAKYMQTTRGIANSKKSFDISHPLKEDYRLRYVCLEGPAAEVYIRGKLENSNIIKLPDYWVGLVDMNSIGVSLTPIGSYQQLFVEKIEGTKIVIKNNLQGLIYCYYVLNAERIDTPKNIPEYKGLTPNDYPGDNESYNVNGL